MSENKTLHKCKNCKKTYKFISGLEKHLITCSPKHPVLENKVITSESKEEREEVKTEKTPNDALTNLLTMILKHIQYISDKQDIIEKVIIKQMMIDKVIDGENSKQLRNIIEKYISKEMISENKIEE